MQSQINTDTNIHVTEELHRVTFLNNQNIWHNFQHAGKNLLKMNKREKLFLWRTNLEKQKEQFRTLDPSYISGE